MSYILEALKQAEEERGSNRLTRLVAVPAVDESRQKSIDWKKWLTIAIFINAVVLSIWVIWKVLSLTSSDDAEHSVVSQESHAIESKTESPQPVMNARVIEPQVDVPKSAPATVVASTPAEKSVVVQPKQTPIAKEQTQALVHAEQKPAQFNLPNTAEPVQTETSAAEVPARLVPTAPISESTLVSAEAAPSIPAVASASNPVIPQPSINAAKVEPLPATPREQLVIESQETMTPQNNAELEGEVPQAMEEIAIVQRPRYRNLRNYLIRCSNKYPKFESAYIFIIPSPRSER